MNAHSSEAAASCAVTLRRVAAFPGIRALYWDHRILYASRGYQIVRLVPDDSTTEWQFVAAFRPLWWRRLTSQTTLTSRLVRDGFHALAMLSDGTMVGAVPGAIVTRTAGSGEFHVTHRILRGTRPLHITSTPEGTIYWGEYFDNRERAEVHVYASQDRGVTWQVAYTFPAGNIRHVHNIVHDRWRQRLWILTGDEGAECKVLRATCDLHSIETVISGNQQARAVAAIPTPEALYLSTDTPYEQNHVYRLDRAGRLEQVADLNASSIYGCQAGPGLFFSTMVEPSARNTDREVHLVGSPDGTRWQTLARWKKDNLSMKYFQYGNAFLPNGENTSSFLAATTIAVADDDQTTILWQVA
jgi:hypothetical protein